MLLAKHSLKSIERNHGETFTRPRGADGVRLMVSSVLMDLSQGPTTPRSFWAPVRKKSRTFVHLFRLVLKLVEAPLLVLDELGPSLSALLTITMNLYNGILFNYQSYGLSGF
jgi:hypothetical protein